VVDPKKTDFWVRSGRRQTFWDLGFGFWVLGFGFWVLGFGFWVLGFGSAVVSRQTVLLTRKVCFGFWVSPGGDALSKLVGKNVLAEKVELESVSSARPDRQDRRRGDNSPGHFAH
jgi:hypothetical protein